MKTRPRRSLGPLKPIAPKHWKGTVGARDVATTDFQLAIASLGEAINEQDIAALIGDPGLGKTFAAKTVAERLKIPFYYLEAAPGLRGRHLTIAMLEALRWPHDPRDTPASLQKELVEACAREPQVLALDEIDRWRGDGVEMARFHWSQATNQTTFIFIGSKVARLIAANPALDSRLEHRVHFRPLDVEEAVVAMRAYHPTFETATEAQLIRVHRLTRGAFREIAKLLKRILVEAGEPAPRLTRDLLSAAWRATGRQA